MTPEDREACHRIEQQGYKLTRELNELYEEQKDRQAQREITVDLMNTNRREIARLQRDRLTACLPGTRSSKRNHTGDFIDRIGILGCLHKIEQIDRQVSELQAGLRELERQLQRVDRRLETLRREIAGKEALFDILRKQKEENGCP